MQLDFTKLIKTYSLLSNDDVIMLNNYFNSQDIQNKLTSIDNSRKIIIKDILIVLIISAIGFLLSIKFININPIIKFIPFFILGIGILIIYFKDKTHFKNDIKTILMPNFVKSINEKINYDQTGKLFTESIEFLCNNGIIKPYDIFDSQQDSISYDISTGINLTGAEIKTSQKHTRTDKDGTSHTYYTTNNHCYITKIRYEQPKYIIEKWIKLNQDKNENIMFKSMIILLISSIIFGGVFLLIKLYNISLDKTYLPIIYGIIIYLVYISTNYFLGRNRVKMENVEFERKFDVYCEDQINSRMILTPSFMYRILDFVNKIDSKRVYELFFFKGDIYIKFDLLKSGKEYNDYLEFNIFKSTFNNLQEYVKFYLEIKNISELVKDLNLFYLEKGNFNK